jgi:vancomycin permeability regulator SanA
LKLEPVLRKNTKTRRQFRARKIAVTVGGDGLTVRYTNPSKMRAELIRAGIIRSGSRIPDEKLARLYQDFRDLKAGAL